MIDLHTHSIFSDGELIPFELCRRLEAMNYGAVAITDHVDVSNLENVINSILKAANAWNTCSYLKLIPGVELTHVPPKLIAPLAERARLLGAKIIVVHGETLVEPVVSGTNRAALEADIDILAHPGLITEEEVMMAKEREICLEISGRKGHCFSNGHVAKLAKKIGAKLVINSDGHAPSDFLSLEMAKKIVCGAGLNVKDFEMALKNAWEIVKKRGIL
ncbi:MAG TPA: histidinol phosphate phosphatase domain-containing protein [Candidatus Desulfofervidus auxilii]|uniref:Histidinol phosphate phosphatase domain-containing protein n=1 Tax=Desulfofervidus auxilii TaxID=1621989 RepID=A0A7V0IAB3_DESA2|nr:histidinol phosphate phosphatase domain-containing protein [Candidatus Desulfofervidus auxilii]